MLYLSYMPTEKGRGWSVRSNGRSKTLAEVRVQNNGRLTLTAPGALSLEVLEAVAVFMRDVVPNI